MKIILFFLFLPSLLFGQSFEGEIKYRFKIQTERESIRKVFEDIQPEYFDLLYKENKMRELSPDNAPYYLENGLQDYSIKPEQKEILNTDWNGEKQQEKKLFKTRKDSVILNKKCTLYQDTENKQNEYWITDEIQPKVIGCKGLIYQGKAVLYQKVLTPNSVFEFQALEINPKSIADVLFELPKNYKIIKMKPVKIGNIYPSF
ncbi:MAG: hypothetical protein EAZ97_03955 [Bacteroidetes bacterium]|nr:MAG: hypothetical protein EAZ97_03955 [Bacteroidota bacterium]